MPEGSTIVETSRGRRLVREYDAVGALVRIRIEPTSRGPVEAPPLDALAPLPRKGRSFLSRKRDQDQVQVPSRPPAPPRRRGFTVIASEPVPLPSPQIVLREEPPEPARIADSQPIAAAFTPPPPAPEHYEVADLESRVDSLFLDPARRHKPKKRAPLPVPQFEPLPREPWEERLDKALGRI
ncbi:MAG: hypothetical protein WDA16_03090 [Candidatus Thermoplasmatota archaeon]